MVPHERVGDDGARFSSATLGGSIIDDGASCFSVTTVDCGFSWAGVRGGRAIGGVFHGCAGSSDGARSGDVAPPAL